MARFRSKYRVVIAGGGVGALECVLALRAHAGDRVAVTLVAPDERFVYRPLSVGEPFALGAPVSVPLASVAGDVGLEYRRDVLVSVAAHGHRVELASGDDLTYEALVVAVGARRVPAFRHAIAFRGSEDSEAVRDLVERVEHGLARRIAFIAPPDVSWTLPLYELALLTARRARDARTPPLELTLVTGEERPLGIFGPAASAEVAEVLDRAGIELELSAHAEVEPNGVVRLRPQGRTLDCDGVVSTASIVPRDVPGLRTDARGFLPVDPHGRVGGVEDVYAAGDATSFPVKQGGLACQQADAAAEAIACEAGAPVEPQPFRPVLRGQLLTGGRSRFIRTDLSGRAGDVSDVSSEMLWWPPSKVAGIYLAPYLTGREAHRSARETTGVVREPVVMVPRSGHPEFEILDFERDSRPVR